MHQVVNQTWSLRITILAWSSTLSVLISVQARPLQKRRERKGFCGPQTQSAVSAFTHCNLRSIILPLRTSRAFYLCNDEVTCGPYKIRQWLSHWIIWRHLSSYLFTLKSWIHYFLYMTKLSFREKARLINWKQECMVDRNDSKLVLVK